MNIKDIAALAEIVKQNELTKLEINGENIVIERAAQVVQAAPILNAVQPAVPEQMHTTEPIAEVKEKEGVYVKSPAVGVFYAAPSPDSKPFVAVGDTVHKGDTLCIIEAMKLMNEINSEMDGEIAEICVGNGQVVEYDQPLFRILSEEKLPERRRKNARPRDFSVERNTLDEQGRDQKDPAAPRADASRRRSGAH